MPRKKTKKQTIEILDLLADQHPDAHCELVHSSAFELLVATILSAQCTDVRVNIVTEEMFKKYNQPQDFKDLSIGQIEDMIKTCGLYKSKAKKIKETSSILVDLYGGQVPDNLEDLVKLPGVGRKTAGVVLSNAFGIPAIAVDTHVFRVANRMQLAVGTTPDSVEKGLQKAIPVEWWSRAHHWLIWHGRRICKARKPLCEDCFQNDICPSSTVRVRSIH